MRKKNVYLAMLALPVIIWLAACHDGLHCIDGNHDVISENRDATDFREIVSEGDFDVFLVQDSIFSVEVEAESNLMPYISTRVKGDILEIDTRNNRCLDNDYPMSIFIHAPDVESVLIEGSGYLSVEEYIVPEFYMAITGSGDIEANLITEYTRLDITGSGDAELWGTSIETEFNISGSGSIRAYDLVQENCFASISGSGDMYLFVTGLLDVKISGSGSIYYRGNPVVNTSISGSGSVIRVN